MKQGIDYIGLGVGGVIINKDGKIFASLRGKAVRNQPGTWEFPGGGIEFGETAAQALEREALEEFGIEVKTAELLGYVDHILPEENQHWLGLSFICNHIRGEGTIQEPDKCERIGWFTPEELKGFTLSTPTRRALDTLEDKYSAKFF